MRFLLVLGMVWLAPRAADACCYEPITSVSPRSWTVLPPHPRILVTIPAELPQRVTANAPLEQRLVDERTFGRTYELRFRKLEGELAVEVPMAHALTKRLTYPIAPVSSRAARVRSITLAGASCAGPGFELRVEGDAIGLRVDWHVGGGSSWSPVWDATAHIIAGDTLRGFDLVALFADGSERTLGTSSMTIHRDGGPVRSPVELLDLYRWPMLAGWFHGSERAWEPSPLDLDDARPRRVAGALLGLVLLLALGYVRPCSWR